MTGQAGEVPAPATAVDSAASIPVMRANSAAELAIAHALNPPPDGVRWLVTSLFWLGSIGVIVLLVLIGLLVPRLTAIRRIVLSGLVTWAVCALLGMVLGPAAGRPVTPALAGFDASYPVTWLAVAIAVAATAVPYLSRYAAPWCACSAPPWTRLRSPPSLGTRACCMSFGRPWPAPRASRCRS